MKLTSCRVQNFRSIEDSGWVDIDDIAVIVGKNESGKTSFLKALWKFNPFQDLGYNIDREWPSGKRREKSPQKVVVSTRFTFTQEEAAEIEKIHESAKGITGVEMTRNYAGEFSHHFVPQNPSTEHSVAWVVDVLNNRLGTLPAPFSEHFTTQYCEHFETIVKEVRDDGGSAHALAKLPEFKNQFPAFRSPNNPAHSQDNSAIPMLNGSVDQVVQDLTATPLLRVVDFVHAHLPTFIYMDDHRTFIGSAQLDDVLKHEKEKHLTPEEETIIVIMKMSGLELEAEVQKGNAEDRQQRNLDMDDASNTLTALIANNWRQRKYQVEFRADGQHFNTYVKDEADKALIPLEDRSKGFQWFFSFDMRFMYETDGQFENAIILLDGQQAFEQLVHQWILKDKLVLMVGDIVGVKPCALEDLFGEAFYLSKVNEAFAKELAGKTLMLDQKTSGKRTVVDRVQDAFTSNGLGEFNKGRVSKRIMTGLAKKTLADVDADTAANFRKVIDALNAIVAGWKKS